MGQRSTTPKVEPEASGELKNKQTKSTGLKGRGGPRPGAGRPKGRGAIRVSAGEAIKLAAEGETPLAYMLRVMREGDEDIDKLLKAKKIDEAESMRMKADRQRRRDWAAQASAPYVHPKLASVDMKVETENKNDSMANALGTLKDDELEQLEELLLKAEQRAIAIDVPTAGKPN